MEATQVHIITIQKWQEWPKIKDTVPDFGFREWIKRNYGYEYSKVGFEFSYTVVDEKKFAWFILSH